MTQHVGQHAHITQLQCIDNVEAGRRDESGELHFRRQRASTGCRQHVQPDGENEFQDQSQEEHGGGVAQNGKGSNARIGSVIASARSYTT